MEEYRDNQKGVKINVCTCPEHDHENKRTGIADQRQRDTRDGEQGNRHPDVLEDMGKNQRSDPYRQQESKLIPRKKRDEDTSQQE